MGVGRLGEGEGEGKHWLFPLPGWLNKWKLKEKTVNSKY
jgi:hypothetical protein